MKSRFRGFALIAVLCAARAGTGRVRRLEQLKQLEWRELQQLEQRLLDHGWAQAGAGWVRRDSHWRQEGRRADGL